MLSFLFPVPLFARAHILRTVLIWVGARLLTALVLSLSREVPPPGPIFLHPLLVAYLLALVLVMAMVDMMMRRERLFLANLGVSRVRVALTSMAVVVPLEAIILVVGTS